MAVSEDSFIRRFSWLFVVTGLVVLLVGWYIVRQVIAYNAQLIIHNATIEQIAQLQPTSGTYSVTGGRLNYVYSQAVGFANDKDKDAGTVYDSYVPFVDKSDHVLMLVLMTGYSPANMWDHIDDPPAKSLTGSFTDPNSVPQEIYNDFSSRKYPVQQGLPVMIVPGGIEPSTLHWHIGMACFLALLIGGGPWGVAYLISRPKKRRKTFSERYPERRIY